MAARRNSFTMDHPVVLTFLILALIAFMYFAAEVLKPLALAILLAFALVPFARFFERHGLPRGLAGLVTIVAALTVLGGVGFIVGQELNDLAKELPQKRRNIESKLSILRPKQDSAVRNLAVLAEDVSKSLEAPLPKPVEAATQDVAPKSSTSTDAKAEAAPTGSELTEPVKVEVVGRPSFQERLETEIGPYLEPLTIFLFVLVLALFLIVGREDLSDRLIQLFGRRRISLTTKTMEEVGHRISRYLAIFATVNSTYGVIVGLGLALIGLPYAVLWGFLAAALRFIPYVGPAVAIILPTVFSVAHAPDWTQPALVVAFFAVLELVATYALEPIVYGKTTGVSALGLLVAAMFWTWLWGALGLLLSTPLTLCLAVLGKYVPSLGAFATLLGEDSELDPDVRFYQRLLAADQDGAIEVVEDELKRHPRVEVFDTVLIPALSRAERDAARGEIDEREQALIWRIVGDVLDDLAGTADLSLAALATNAEGPSISARVVGIAANDTADGLVLRMLALSLEPSQLSLEIVTGSETPLALADSIAEREPDLVILSHLPPVGLTSARYLTRRLRARLPELPLFVGRWGEGGDVGAVDDKLTASGASKVVFGVVEARDQVLSALMPKAVAPEPLGVAG